MRRLSAALFASLLACAPASAIETSLQIVLDLPGNAERNVVPYQCEGLEPFEVEYVNANPIFLAFVPVNGEKLIFVNVLSASGARYASGQYVWWTEGSSAELYDGTLGEDAPPTACQEATETP